VEGIAETGDVITGPGPVDEAVFGGVKTRVVQPVGIERSKFYPRKGDAGDHIGNRTRNESLCVSRIGGKVVVRNTHVAGQLKALRSYDRAAVDLSDNLLQKAAAAAIVVQDLPSIVRTAEILWNWNSVEIQHAQPECAPDASRENPGRPEAQG